jgi:hypothetical protein
MNIYFNHFSNHFISHLNESVLPSLTSQQKRILIVASIAFGVLAACLIACRCCFKLQISFISDDDDDSAGNNSPQSSLTKITLTDGTIMEGSDFDENGKLQGQGKITFPTGEVHQGEFRDGELFGEGIRTLPNGAIKKGKFVYGDLHGLGIVEYERGQGLLDEGFFFNDILIQGRRTWRGAGRIEEGKFQDGLLHGPGKIIHPDGKIEEGTFDHGQLVVKKQ